MSELTLSIVVSALILLMLAAWGFLLHYGHQATSRRAQHQQPEPKRTHLENRKPPTNMREEQHNILSREERSS